MNNHTYFVLLIILCLSFGCSKANVLLKDAEKVNEDLIKMEIDAESPVS